MHISLCKLLNVILKEGRLEGFGMLIKKYLGGRIGMFLI